MLTTTLLFRDGRKLLHPGKIPPWPTIHLSPTGFSEKMPRLNFTSGTTSSHFLYSIVSQLHSVP